MAGTAKEKGRLLAASTDAIVLSLLSAGAVLAAAMESGYAYFLLLCLECAYAARVNRSWSAFLELSLVLVVALLVPESDSSSRCMLALVSAGAAALFTGSRRGLGIVWTALPVAAGAAAMFASPAGYRIVRPLPLVFAASALPGFFIYSLNRAGSRRALRTADVVLCSFSGNTAHAAETFVAGMESAGVAVTRHRYQKQHLFHPQLAGDSFVFAFPVIGWKPPWPLCGWLLRNLPRGGGKPAFILYSSAGGPENAGMVTWLLLTLKGYRVIGRGWAVYPVDLPTVRLGTARLWRFFDHLIPPESDISALREMGRAFARGEAAGQPFILWPFPLVAVGILLDNPLFDRALMRNYVWKKRCIRCGTCVRSCPMERLRMEEYPKVSGDCCLCFGCVNLCPRNAMHIAGFTEYGKQYRPRWPELLPSRSGGGEPIEDVQSPSGADRTVSQGE